MSDTKNRAASSKRRAARVIKVAPVTLAIRAALAVSTTAFAFSASAAAHVANPPVATSAAQHQSVHHFAVIQPVVDLTTVKAMHLPSSVFDAPVAVHHSAGIAASGDVAVESESLGAVQDLLAVPTLTPGPGGVSGSDNGIFIDLSGNTTLNSSSGTFTGPTSTTGYADFVFAHSDHFNGFTNNGDISATGATWAAGFELEADTYARDVRNSSTGTITTTATGMHGQAWGIYATAVDDAQVYNDGVIDVTASGKYGTATGLFDYSQTSTATAGNTGTINAYATAKYGHAVGIYAAAYGDASATNSGYVTAQANGVHGSAIGVSAYSITGNASASNSAGIVVDAYGDATGLSGIAAQGDVTLDNTGSIDVYSFQGTAVGVYGYAASGDVTITNTGGISAYSYDGIADGIFASGTNVSVTNGGSIDSTGYYWAAGIEAQGSDLTTVTNTGTITATTYAAGGPNTYGAYGIFATGGAGGVSVDSSGDISAYGAYAFGVNVVSDGAVAITNTGGIIAGDPYSYLAVGIQASTSYDGADIVVQNDGGISATSIYGSNGIDVAALGAGASASVTNTGGISATQYSSFGYGAYGIVASADYNATIDNSGGITVYSGAGGYGAVALAFDGDASVDNSGVIDVTGYVGMGAVASSANGGASVDNSGTIHVDGSYIGMGIQATGTTGAAVTHSGDITVSAGYAYGIYANGGNGDASVSIADTGTINVNAYFGIGAIGLSTYGNVILDNAGDIQTEAYGQSVGLFARSAYGSASVTNTGSLIAYSYAGTAVGAFARADGGDVSIDNAGGIGAISIYGDGTAIRASALTTEVTNTGNAQGISIYGLATGIDVYGATSATVGNDGLVTAGSKYGTAHGIYAVSGGDVTVTNGSAGEIQAYAPEGAAWGVIAYSLGGMATVDNAGYVTVEALDGATGMYAGGAGAALSNSGTLDVHAYDGPAIGMFGYSTDGAVDISNSGMITAYSDTDLADGIFASGLTVDVTNTSTGAITAAGYAWAAGIEAQGGDAVTVTNDGAINAYSAYNAYGIYATAGAGGATIGNTGPILALGLYATGIEVRSEGAISIGNTGDITVGDADYTALATGIHAVNNYEASDIVVTNDGDITVAAYYGATGIDVSATGAGSSASVGNTGSIDVNHSTTYGYGAVGIAVSADNNASIDNAGAITTVSGVGSYGAMALAFSGDANVVNSGDIDVTSTAFKYYSAIGMLSASSAGAAFADNSGDVHVAADKYIGTGIQVSGNTGATATNSGAISVSAKYAYGIVGTAGQGDVSIGNSAAGTIDVFSGMNVAAGMLGISTVGDVSIDNAGSVSAIAYGGAFGAFARADDGNASVTNSGSLYAYSYGDQATGVFALATNGDVSVDNSGSIEAVAYYGDAIGVYGVGTNSTSFLGNSGSIAATGGLYGAAIGVLGVGYASSVNNSGSIAATGYGNADGVMIDVYAAGALSNAATGHIAAIAMGDAYGAFVTSYAGVASVDNAGLIEAATTYAAGTAAGVYAAGHAGTQVVNSGTITAQSATGGDAIGVIARSNGMVLVNNSGAISAMGYNNAGGAVIDAYADGFLSNAAAGHIAATAMGDAYGAFVTSYAGVASVDNAGLIEATTTYAGGTAAGVYAVGYAGTQVVNSGTITAQSATGGDAIGVIARGNGTVLVNNSGTISAIDDDYAVGVSMDSATGTATLVNTGLIRTYSTLEGEIAVNGGDGVQHVLNYGDIYGAVITAGGDDVFSNGNAGTWHVTNHSTDFGDGDDTIDNAAGGTIELASGAIHLGASGSAGNAFINAGTIRVLGNGTVDMGTSGSAANLLPLENNGIIDFVDGATDDMLSIIGDLGGTGAVNLDLNPVTTSADQLNVDGDVTGTQTVNVNLAGAALSGHVDPIVFAHVTGDSAAGSFVGGGVVGYDLSSFLDLQVNVTSQIDTSNATSDVFAVGLDVAGLNDGGSLAATLTSSAQSIVNTQVGTWRQRMGVLPQKRSDMVGLSPWIRFFSDNGTVNASHTADNFGNGGTFSFDQTTTGRELGMNVDFDNGFNAGLLLAKTDGSEHLRGSSIGSDHIDSSTFGLYGTWISQNGFYVDASYRWIGFDAHLKSTGGSQSTEGNGEAFNVEAGYTAWTFGGVDIAPQLQYTRTTVDGFQAIRGSSIDFLPGDATSSRGRAGVAFSKTINGAGWIWTPYGSVNAVREFDGENRYVVGDVFSGVTKTDGTSAMVELGLGAQKNGVSVTGGANWTDGGAMQSFVGGQLVLRYTW